MLRHAVDAAEVATVGHRDSQVRDGALEWVDQVRRTRLSAAQTQWQMCRSPTSWSLRISSQPATSSYRKSGRYWLCRPGIAANYGRLRSGHAINSGYSASYCRTGGALVGQGEAGCAGAAVIGAGAAAAAGCGRAADFFVAGFLAAGFLVPRGCCASGRELYDDRVGSKTGRLTRLLNCLQLLRFRRVAVECERHGERRFDRQRKRAGRTARLTVGRFGFGTRRLRLEADGVQHGTGL